MNGTTIYEAGLRSLMPLQAQTFNYMVVGD